MASINSLDLKNIAPKYFNIPLSDLNTSSIIIFAAANIAIYSIKYLSIPLQYFYSILFINTSSTPSIFNK